MREGGREGVREGGSEGGKEGVREDSDRERGRYNAMWGLSDKSIHLISHLRDWHDQISSGLTR